MAPSRGFVKLRTSALVCLACMVEGADMAVLPAVYLFIARSLHASPSELGVMTLCRALMQALSSPIRYASIVSGRVRKSWRHSTVPVH